MTDTPAPSRPTRADEYRRAARRLRGRYAGRPGRLHQSLKALAEDCNEPPPARVISRQDRHGRPGTDNPRWARPNVPVRQGSSAGFAEHVAGALKTSSVLRYSQRLQLIRDARRFGISRFEANLVIAAMMARRSDSVGETSEPKDRSFVSAATTFFIVQGALALGAWWVLFR